jgi:hypothetical protein
VCGQKRLQGKQVNGLLTDRCALRSILARDLRAVTFLFIFLSLLCLSIPFLIFYFLLPVFSFLSVFLISPCLSSSLFSFIHSLFISFSLSSFLSSFLLMCYKIPSFTCNVPSQTDLFPGTTHLCLMRPSLVQGPLTSRGSNQYCLP